MLGTSGLASGFLWGSLSDRLGRRYGLALIFLMQAVSFALFGDRLRDEEAQALITKVLTSDPIPTCPHGRPVAFIMPDAELRKRFQR